MFDFCYWCESTHDAIFVTSSLKLILVTRGSQNTGISNRMDTQNIGH